MLKWVWRFYSKKCSLWTKMIKAIYGEDENLNKDVSGGVRTCWTSIVHDSKGCYNWFRGINVADYNPFLKLGMGVTRSSGSNNWYEGGVSKAVPTYVRYELLEMLLWTILVALRRSLRLGTLESEGVGVFSVASIR
ncbi:hypothetical protein Tco_0591796 [Tanacetum coccineum]